jgi:methionyl-tRNA synthetase
MPQIHEVAEDGTEDYPVLMGDYASARDAGATWQSSPIESGTPLAPPTPIFVKLDPSIAEEEVARLAAESAEA